MDYMKVALDAMNLAYHRSQNKEIEEGDFVLDYNNKLLLVDEMGDVLAWCLDDSGEVYERNIKDLTLHEKGVK